MVQQHGQSVHEQEFETLRGHPRYSPRSLISVRDHSSVLCIHDRLRRAPAILKRTRRAACAADRHTPECCALAFEGSMLRQLAALGVGAPFYLNLFHRDGYAHLVMEYVSGGTLEQAARSGCLTGQAALQAVDQIAAVLAAVHDLGIVHQDVKPANVLLPHGRLAMLIDWGSAGYERGAHERVRYFSFTPLVASGEQRAGHVLASNDIFSLGRTLALVYPDPPWRVASVIARATAPLSRRYTTVTAFRSALRAAAAAVEGAGCTF